MSLIMLESQTRGALISAPTHPAPAPVNVSLMLVWQGDPWVGEARAVAWDRSGTVSIAAFGTGAQIVVSYPASAGGRTVDLIISADTVPAGVVTGVRDFVLPSVDTDIAVELDVSSSAPPDTSIIGRVAGDLIGYDTAIPHDVIVVGIDAPSPVPLARVVPDGAGHYDATWYEYTGRVIAVAIGNQGTAWVENAELLAGDILVPSTGYAGYVYIVTAPGNAGGIEPTWWTTPGQSAPVGAATAVCRTYPRPVATGPVSPDVTLVSP